MNNLTSTIAAISTPPGKGGVALIRISGADAVSIAEKCFVPKGRLPLCECAPRTAIYGDVIFEGERIDDAIATVFRNGASYTGEDTVEISCHGGILISRTVLEAVLAAGAVPASAGEFTRRAFINGKLSLSDAEAIGMLLEAKTHSQILLNSSSSRNKLNEKTQELHSSVILLLSTMYAKIDYPDEDLADMSSAEIVEALQKINTSLTSLAKSYKTGRAINEGIQTVICGKPNVGKSTLYNTLCGGNYAIVSEYEGTTRDLLERTVSLGSVTLNLCDTAGIRKTDAPVEQIGISLSREKISDAELIFAVFDGSRSLDEYDLELIETLSSAKATVIAVINKGDLSQVIDSKKIENAFENTVYMSASSSKDVLKSVVEKLFYDEQLTLGEDAIVSSARQYSTLVAAKEHIELAISALSAGYPFDIASSDIEACAAALSELDGRAVSEDVVSGIFSHFCVGK